MRYLMDLFSRISDRGQSILLRYCINVMKLVLKKFIHLDTNHFYIHKYSILTDNCCKNEHTDEVADDCENISEKF